MTTNFPGIFAQLSVLIIQQQLFSSQPPAMLLLRQHDVQISYVSTCQVVYIDPKSTAHLVIQVGWSQRVCYKLQNFDLGTPEITCCHMLFQMARNALTVPYWAANGQKCTDGALLGS